jgi:Bacteriocin-protection, YdeI or OmpD-Associated/Domain of unknown function (DUF1905)
MVRFKGTIEKAGDDANVWWIVRVPPDEAAALRKVRRVRGTIGGVAFAGGLLHMGEGVRCVHAKRDLCKRAGIAPGDVVEVALEADPEADVVAIPDELAAVLRRRPVLQKTFDAFSPAHRREYASWIGEAKRPETRAARAEKAVAMIGERKHP